MRVIVQRDPDEWSGSSNFDNSESATVFITLSGEIFVLKIEVVIRHHHIDSDASSSWTGTEAVHHVTAGAGGRVPGAGRCVVCARTYPTDSRARTVTND